MFAGTLRQGVDGLLPSAAPPVGTIAGHRHEGVGLMIQIPIFVLLAVTAKQSHLMLLWTVLGQVGNFLGGILVAPVHTIGFALFYYDLRVRKEAFDLQMMMQAIGADPMPPPITGGVPSMFGRDAS